MSVIDMDYEEIYKNLTILIAHENDPVRKNLSLAKIHAVRMICAGFNPFILIQTLLAYFDDDVVNGCQTVLWDSLIWSN